MERLPEDESLREPTGLVLQGTYRLERAIGHGGMGVVYEATHARLPGRFAVKFLSPGLASNPEAFARFCREAEIMSELRHPNVVRIFDFNMTPDGLPYFVMERLDGCDLAMRLSRKGRLPLTKAVSIVSQVASALSAAHHRGIIHRDLKPSNIFLIDVEGEDDTFVKVLDFGVSKSTSGVRLTRALEIIGTPHYMSPEQAQGRSDELDARADQFALAAIAYEMLTGKVAFDDDDASALLHQIIHGPTPQLDAYLPWDCAGLQDVLDRALEKDPRTRYPSIAGFAGALAAAAEVALCPVTPAPQLRKAARARGAGAAPDEEPLADAAGELTDEAAAEGETEAAPEGDSGAYDEMAVGWDLPSSVDRIPISPYRALWLVAIAVALLALIVGKGWARELPTDIVLAYRGLAAWALRRPPAPQPPAAAAAATPPAAATTEKPGPEPPPEPAAAPGQPGAAAEPPSTAAPAPSAEPAPAVEAKVEAKKGAPADPGTRDEQAAAQAPAPRAKRPARHRPRLAPRSDVIELRTAPPPAAPRARSGDGDGDGDEPSEAAGTAAPPVPERAAPDNADQGFPIEPAAPTPAPPERAPLLADPPVAPAPAPTPPAP